MFNLANGGNGRLPLAEILPDGSTVNDRLRACLLGIINEKAAAAGAPLIGMPDFGTGEGDIYTINATTGQTNIPLLASNPDHAFVIVVSDQEALG